MEDPPKLDYATPPSLEYKPPPKKRQRLVTAGDLIFAFFAFAFPGLLALIFACGCVGLAYAVVAISFNAVAPFLICLLLCWFCSRSAFIAFRWFARLLRMRFA